MVEHFFGALSGCAHNIGEAIALFVSRIALGKFGAELLCAALAADDCS